jgi:hypothetical protein
MIHPSIEEVFAEWNGEGPGRILRPHTIREIATAKEIYNIMIGMLNKIEDETFREFLERTEGI